MLERWVAFGYNGADPEPLMPADLFTSDLATTICERIASGESLRAICRDAGMPSEVTVRRWATENRDGFGPRFVAARAEQAHALFDEILDTARAGGDAASVRAKVDALKWAASKMLPKTYGDRTEVEHSGSLTLEQLVLSSMRNERAGVGRDTDG